MFCWIASQQGHFGALILWIPMQKTTFSSIKAACIFAFWLQLVSIFSFLLIQFCTVTLSVCLHAYPFSQCNRYNRMVLNVFFFFNCVSSSIFSTCWSLNHSHFIFLSVCNLWLLASTFVFKFCMHCIVWSGVQALFWPCWWSWLTATARELIAALH